MRITRASWLLLGVLICLSGCGPTRTPAPDSPRPPGQIPTPQDAPAEPTFKPDVPPAAPPRFRHDDRPLQPLSQGASSNAGGSPQTHRDGFGQGWRAMGMVAKRVSEEGGACGA
jgi:hypothetical protein